MAETAGDCNRRGRRWDVQIWVTLSTIAHRKPWVGRFMRRRPAKRESPFNRNMNRIGPTGTCRRSISSEVMGTCGRDMRKFYFDPARGTERRSSKILGITSDGCDGAQVAAAPSDRTQTRRCPSCRPLRFRIRHKRSRTCCGSVERAGAFAALGSRGDTVGRTGWSPRIRRSCRAGSYLNFTHGPERRAGTLNQRLEDASMGISGNTRDSGYERG